LLHPPRDAPALAAALVRQIQEPGLRQHLREEAAREVRQTWLYSRAVRRMWSVYAEMCTAAEEMPMMVGFPGIPSILGIQGDHFPMVRRAPHLMEEISPQ
jgi:hypothetical protein